MNHFVCLRVINLLEQYEDEIRPSLPESTRLPSDSLDDADAIAVVNKEISSGATIDDLESALVYFSAARDEVLYTIIVVLMRGALSAAIGIGYPNEPSIEKNIGFAEEVSSQLSGFLFSDLFVKDIVNYWNPHVDSWMKSCVSILVSEKLIDLAVIEITSMKVIDHWALETMINK